MKNTIKQEIKSRYDYCSKISVIKIACDLGGNIKMGIEIYKELYK